MRKLISIILCLAMVLGSAASVFAKETSQGTAATLRLEKTEGTVGITKTGGKTVTVKDGIRLYDGYEIKTGSKSAAYVSLDSAKAIMLDASTDVTIKKNGSKLDIMLKSGTVLVNVEDKLKGNEELNIRTTNSVTGIRGTILQACFNPETQNTEIYLFEGKTTGQYLGPDGTWYTQELTTGSWLASGMGMLADNLQYNGWVKKDDGTWIYTNNNIQESGFQTWCWSEEQGWYTINNETGKVSTQEAWPFTFTQLQPKVQTEILNTPSMLERGQEHLDLYPELAENKVTETKAASAEALALQQETAEEKSAAIEEAFVEGNGGKTTVDNLFVEKRRPSRPSNVTISFNDLSSNAELGRLIANKTAIEPNADGSYTVPYGETFTFTFAAGPYKVSDNSGNIIASDHGSYSAVANSNKVLTIEDMPETGTRSVNVSITNFPDQVSVASYGNNVLTVEDSVAAGATKYTLAEDEVLNLVLSEADAYGVTAVTGAIRNSTYSYTVGTDSIDATFDVSKLSLVSSPNAVLSLDASSDTPYKTFSDGRFYFVPGQNVFMRVSGYEYPDAVVLITYSLSTVPSESKQDMTDGLARLETNAGEDYDIVYAPDGYYDVSVNGALAAAVNVVSTDTTLYHYTNNGSEVYLVKPETDFVFSVDGATSVTAGIGTTTLSPEVDGYYHLLIEGNAQVNVN